MVWFEFLEEFFRFGQERKNGCDILPDLFGLFFYVLVHCDFAKSLPGTHCMKDHLAAEFRDRHGSHLFSDLPSSVQGGHSLQTEQKSDLYPNEMSAFIKYFYSKNLIENYDIKEYDKFHIF